MSKTKGLLFTAGIVLATAFTLSCEEKNANKPSAAVAELTDNRDGKKYKTVKIGAQTWMAENLNHDASGSKCYDNKPANCEKYGRLYDWATAMKACPAGWHLPNADEWETLIDATGDASVGRTKLNSTSGWNDYSGKSTNGTDEFGFSALPGGNGNGRGGFDNAGYDGFWWSATDVYDDHAWYLGISYNNEGIYRNDHDVLEKSNLFSVRCLQDGGGQATEQQPAVESGEQSSAVDSRVVPFIPDGYTIRFTASGNLNLDKYEDMVLVVERKGETDESVQENSRALLILVGQADGKYKLAARNDKVVWDAYEGGQFGDAFQKAVIKDGYFSVENMGGSTKMWTRIITFKYSKEDKAWYLHKDSVEIIDRLNPDNITTEVKTVKDFGKISFQQFDRFKGYSQSLPPVVDLYQYDKSRYPTDSDYRIWGWSKDGKVAYSYNISDGGETTAYVNWLDLAVDNELVDLWGRYEGVDNDADDNKLAAFYDKFREACKEKGIEFVQAEYRKLPINHKGRTYNVIVEKNKVDEDGTELVENYMIIVETQGKRKSVRERTELTMGDAPYDVFTLGYFISPLENRAMLVIGTYYRGGMVFTSFVGIDLD